MKLSTAMKTALQACLTDKDRLAYPHPKAPAPTRAKMAQALQDAGLVEPISLASYPSAGNWMLDGRNAFLQVTDAGLRAIGVEPPPAEEASKPADPFQDLSPDDGDDNRPRHEQLGIDESKIYGDEPDAPPAPRSRGISQALAAQAIEACRMALPLLVDIKHLAGDDERAREALEVDIRMLLRAVDRARDARPARAQGPAKAPRAGTKQDAVLALLRREAGASGPEIQQATGWAAHTVRGFLAGLKKKGHTVTSLGQTKTEAGRQTSYRVEG